MIRNLIGGIAVGVANIIPGVSGGTMMVILGIFNRVNEAISGVFKVHNENRKEDILFLVQILLGAGIGLVGFAKILTFCFDYFPTQTMFWFVGLVAFSIPVFMKTELKNYKTNVIWVFIGMGIIFLISAIAPDKTGDVNPAIPSLGAMICMRMVFVGMIGGFSMLLPGISGSMMMLILGDYYLFKTLLANVTSFDPTIIILLGFIGIGILLGIVVAAKMISFLLKKTPANTLSCLLGLVIASTVVLIPFQASYDGMTILTSVFALGFGGFLVYILERFA